MNAAFTINDRPGVTLVYRAVTLDGELWAYRREYPDGHYDQYTPGSIQYIWWMGDVMQYFSPIQR